MAERLFVTIRTKQTREENLLELPGDQAVSNLIPLIIKALQLTWRGAKVPKVCRLKKDDQTVLDSSHTLFQAGVKNFDLLWLEETDASPIAEPADPVNDEKIELIDAVPGNDQSPAPNQTLSRQFKIIAEPDKAYLTSEDGFMFILSGQRQLIGRKSPGIQPDIDLSDLDKSMKSSRRHAEIASMASQYYCQALITKNGTFLNGEEIPAGETRKLQDRDELTFGFGGVRLKFRLSQKE